jgi:hypothetical protein
MKSHATGVTEATASFAQQDLDAVSDVAMMRLPLRAAEWQRLQRMRALLDAATELTRQFGSYTQCMLVNCGGSHGVGDLSAETEAMFGALERYATVVREIAAEYARMRTTRVPDLGLLAGSAAGAVQPGAA